MPQNSIVEAWKKILNGSELKDKGNTWVVFNEGTIVFVEGLEDNQEVEEAATKLMREKGPVIAGTPHGDFNVNERNNNYPG